MAAGLGRGCRDVGRIAHDDVEPAAGDRCEQVAVEDLDGQAREPGVQAGGEDRPVGPVDGGDVGAPPGGGQGEGTGTCSDVEDGGSGAEVLPVQCPGQQFGVVLGAYTRHGASTGPPSPSFRAVVPSTRTPRSPRPERVTGRTRRVAPCEGAPHGRTS